MSHAKLIWISWLAIACITLISYTSVQAYTYFTTTTIEDVRKQNEAFEKAKSELLKARVEYCNDTSTGKIDYDSCGEFLNKSLNAKATTGSVIPEPKQNKLDEVKLQECLSKYKKIDNTISNVCMDYAEWTRTSNIDFELETEKLSQLHKKVCERQINSPLCKDEALFDRLYQLTEERLPWKNFYPILLWITNAESSLGLNFARDRVWWTCTWRNNWGWTKYKINDDNTRDFSSPKFWYDYKNKGKDDYGCYLYPFESVEEFWITKVNGMRFGYPWCINHKTPIRCLSWPYVGDRNVQEQSWINNVSIFL